MKKFLNLHSYTLTFLHSAKEMTNFHVLSLLMFLPLIGAIFIALFVSGKDEKEIARVSTKKMAEIIQLRAHAMGFFFYSLGEGGYIL